MLQELEKQKDLEERRLREQDKEQHRQRVQSQNVERELERK